MRHLTIAATAIAAVLAAAPAAADPVQDPVSAAAPGQIDFTYNRSSPTAAAADRTALQAKGVKLRDLILAVPALSAPRGFSLHSSVVLERPPASGSGEPDVVRGTVQSRRINVSRSSPDAQGRYPGDGEGPALLLAINRLETALGYRSKAGFFTLPVKRLESDGLLQFERSGRDYLVVTPSGLAAYQPVSIGDYAAAALEAYDADGSKDLASQMRAATAGLSPAQLKAPYCKTSAMESVDLALRCRQPGAELVVRLNPHLALGAGAATRAGLVVLGVPQLGRIGDAQERARLRLAVSQLDMAAIRALLSAG